MVPQWDARLDTKGFCPPDSPAELTWKTQTSQEPTMCCLQAVCWGAGGRQGMSPRSGHIPRKKPLGCESPSSITLSSSTITWGFTTSTTWWMGPGLGWGAPSRCLLAWGFGSPVSHCGGSECLHPGSWAAGHFPTGGKRLGGFGARACSYVNAVCVYRLHLHPEPARGGAGGRDGLPLGVMSSLRGTLQGFLSIGCRNLFDL